MKHRPILIRFIDISIKNSIADPRHLLNSKTLRKYFKLIDITLYKSRTNEQYLFKKFKTIKSLNCTSYKVIINLHGISVNNLPTHLIPIHPFCRIDNNELVSFIDFFKALRKPIEILNLCCYGGLSKYINELPKGSSIIDVANERSVWSDCFIHPSYSRKAFQEYFYGNGIDFFKILALYNLFCNLSTNDKSAISIMNMTFDIDKEIKKLKDIKKKDILDNAFLQRLIKYKIITREILVYIDFLISNKTNYSFSYTYKQFIIDMKHRNFPKNLINKISKFYPKNTYYHIGNTSKYDLIRVESLNITKLSKKQQKLFFKDVRQKNVPYYSYQKFLAIVIKYIK
jgi:hypothetical protein